MKQRTSLSFLILFSLLSAFSLITTAFAGELIIEPDAGRMPILSAINQATSSINLVIYGFTDERFIEALIHAKNTGKSVQILMEQTPYKTENENAAAIEQFQAHGVSLRWPDNSFKLLHQKMFLFDQNRAMIMTFNLTHSTFKNERNFALVITDPAETREIQTVFNADWKHTAVSVNNPNLIWSPDNAREKILSFIQSATSSIQIYDENISDFQVIGALAKAARKGVNIKILVSVDPEKWNSKKFAFLKKAGVEIENSQHYLIHAKVIIVDNKKAMIGSINLTKPSLDNNRELAVLTQDPKVIRQLLNTFYSDWKEKEPLEFNRAKLRQWSSTHILREIKRLCTLA